MKRMIFQLPSGWRRKMSNAGLVGDGFTRRLLALDGQRPDQPDDGDVAEHQDFLDGETRSCRSFAGSLSDRLSWSQSPR